MAIATFSCRNTSNLEKPNLIAGNIYYVLVDGYNGVAGNFGIKITALVASGIEEAKERIALTIAPNPATETAVITLNEAVQVTQIALFDAAGRLVQYNDPGSILSDRFDIQVGALEPGVYLLRLVLENGESISTRLVKL